MRIDGQDAKSKNAMLRLKLKADSGYLAEESQRISADQWERILTILNETS